MSQYHECFKNAWCHEHEHLEYQLFQFFSSLEKCLVHTLSRGWGFGVSQILDNIIPFPKVRVFAEMEVKNDNPG